MMDARWIIYGNENGSVLSTMKLHTVAWNTLHIYWTGPLK
jgi:hypothetical protein